MPGRSRTSDVRSSLSTQLALVAAAGVLVASSGVWWATREASETRDRDSATREAERSAATLAGRFAKLQRGERLAFYEQARRQHALFGIADLRGQLWPGSSLSATAISERHDVIVEGRGVLHLHGVPYAAAAAAAVPAAPELVVLSASPITTSHAPLAVVGIALLVAACTFAGVAFGARRTLRVSPSIEALELAGEGLRVSPTPRPGAAELTVLHDAIARVAERVARTEEQLVSARLAQEHADRAKSAFLATVSHELRTPLQAVLGFADVLLEGIDGPLAAEQLENVRVIRKSGDYLLTLVTDALDLSAIASGSFALGADAVDVATVAEEVIDIARGAAQVDAMQLRLEAEHGLPPARADATRMRQVLHNLVGNALKHARGSEVVVRVRRGAQATIEVQVHDEGPGISPADLERIFEPYQRVGDSERTSGVGLGLTIARALVEHQGGHIAVASEPGLGTAFTVRWPSVVAASDSERVA